MDDGGGIQTQGVWGDAVSRQVIVEWVLVGWGEGPVGCSGTSRRAVHEGHLGAGSVIDQHFAAVENEFRLVGLSGREESDAKQEN